MFAKMSEQHEETTTSTEFFSSVFTAMGEQSYCKTSNTIRKNGKVVSSTQEVFQNGKKIDETTITNEYFVPDNSKFQDPIYNCGQEAASVFEFYEQNVDDSLFNMLNSFASFCPQMQEEDSKINMASKKILKEKDIPNGMRFNNKKASKKVKVS